MIIHIASNSNKDTGTSCSNIDNTNIDNTNINTGGEHIRRAMAPPNSAIYVDDFPTTQVFLFIILVVSYNHKHIAE